MAGTQYEPYIFAALNSAKVMIVVGTKPEHLNAVWVKNEWSRFLAMMKKDRHKLLLPCYRDMDPYDMPEALSVLQSYDMSKIGFIQDLIRGISKVLDADKKATNVKETVVVQQSSATPVASLLQRAFMFLEDEDWDSANQYCEKVLDLEPQNAQAYVGKLMAELKIHKVTELSNCAEPFDSNANYQKAVRFADPELTSVLQKTVDSIKQRKQDAWKDKTYNLCRKIIDGKVPETLVNLQAAITGFQSISGWKDADELCMVCHEKAKACEEEIARQNEEKLRQNEATYLSCIDIMKKADSADRYDYLAQHFSYLGSYKNARQFAAQCKAQAENIRKQAEIERKRKEEEERKQAEIERKRKDEERIAAEKEQRKAKLEQERTALQTELANLKGLFSGKRRREIEARLATIERMLKDL